MSRHRCAVYRNDRQPRYVVLWTLQWEVVTCRMLQGGANLQAAMSEAVDEADRDGWVADGTAEFGFVFLRRGDVRRLLMLTPRDPGDAVQQSFNPFRG
jgi:hypothetical protein